MYCIFCVFLHTGSVLDFLENLRKLIAPIVNFWTVSKFVELS
jgi:hypothetical protein